MYHYPGGYNPWYQARPNNWGPNNWNQASWNMMPNQQMPNQMNQQHLISGREDFGGNPFVVDMEKATTNNDYFRRALWTGEYLQVTLMSIGVGEDIGLEVHPDTDQFLRIEEGQGLTMMGDSENRLDFRQPVYADDAIMIPAGKYHNLINTGNTPLKLYSIYAPPEHPFGTVHETKQDAMEAEENH
ncbi:cupin domain-containing protein [Piscibacillus salipiscarius]|uniref:Cupin domain-containing protein n=1 Tax=Piscibacillus salipiscarius TaxID=299480 RepID=A0ABW5Q8C8_9BACI